MDFPLLDIADVSVWYGSLQALDHISLKLQPGVFSLLGPNGAGKSTLLRILASVQVPTQGRVSMDGCEAERDSFAWRQRLGYLPQDFGLPGRLTVFEWLDHVGVIKGTLDARERLAQVESLLTKVNLWQRRDHRIDSLSGGMRQRLGVAQALWGEPSLLVLDEPSSGLDVDERYNMLDLLAEAGRKSVVILSSHIVSEIQDVCGRVGMLAAGRLLFDGAPSDAVKAIAGQVWERPVLADGRADALVSFPHARLFWRDGEMRQRQLAEHSPGETFQPVAPTLTDAYLARIGQTATGTIA